MHHMSQKHPVFQPLSNKRYGGGTVGTPRTELEKAVFDDGRIRQLNRASSQRIVEQTLKTEKLPDHFWPTNGPEAPQEAFQTHKPVLFGDPKRDLLTGRRAKPQKKKFVDYPRPFLHARLMASRDWGWKPFHIEPRREGMVSPETPAPVPLERLDTDDRARVSRERRHDVKEGRRRRKEGALNASLISIHEDDAVNHGAPSARSRSAMSHLQPHSSHNDGRSTVAGSVMTGTSTGTANTCNTCGRKSRGRGKSHHHHHHRASSVASGAPSDRTFCFVCRADDIPPECIFCPMCGNGRCSRCMRVNPRKANYCTKCGEVLKPAGKTQIASVDLTPYEQRPRPPKPMEEPDPGTPTFDK